MKKLAIFVCLVMLIVSAFSCCSASLIRGVWKNPKNIKVYIPPNHRRTVMMKHAFAEWTRKTNQRIIFRYVSSPDDAQMRVYFVKYIDPKKYSGSDRAVGLALTYPAGGRYITHAKVIIADFAQNGRTLSKDEVYTIMLHEIGHAIGLNHSNDPDSIMFPEENVELEISKHDLYVLKKLYQWN